MSKLVFITNALAIAIKALKTNRLRTVLTMIGIVIGVMAIVVVLSLGAALKVFVLSELEAFGTDLIDIEIKAPATGKTSAKNATSIAQGLSITTLKLADAEAISELPNVKNFYAGVMSQEVVSVGENNKRAFLFGATASVAEVDKAVVISQGRFFNARENRSQAKVVVLGSEMVKKLFPNGEDPIGQRISIRQGKYTVIGTLNERGSAFFFNFDDMVYLPIKTLQKQVLGIDHVSFIMAQVENEKITEPTAETIRELMRERHEIDDPSKEDFAVTSMVEAAGILDTITSAITMLLVLVGGVSLVVGGVGIMNIMLVSVAERTREVGLRKAVGANNQDILYQFLAESTTLTLLGGVIGVVLGVIVGVLITIGARATGWDWDFVFSFQAMVLGVVTAAVIGAVFGLYPARKASRLSPMEALRYE